MRGRQKLVAAIGSPFDRLTQLERTPGHHRILGIEAGLHAETATDIADHDPHLVLGNAEDGVAQRGAGA